MADLKFTAVECNGDTFKSKYSGTNMSYALTESGDLLLKIDTKSSIGKSAKGNNMTACSGGFTMLPTPTGGIRVSLNAMPV